MTDIEFKVQFVSESLGGKGSCKGTVFKEMEVRTWKANAGVGVPEAASGPPPLGSSGPKLVWSGGGCL